MLTLTLFITLVASDNIPNSNIKREITRIGGSCQICLTIGGVEACKYHKKCPVKEEKKED